jgi:predicted porin
MKKSLIAMAAFAATSAFAQSSVTMYGIVEAGADIGYNRVINTVTTNAVGATTANTRTETKNGFRIQDGNDQGSGTSRVGFRGTEDLGGGLKANFLLEMGLRLDDGCVTANGTVPCSSGNSGGNLFGRNAWGGVSGGFGEVRLGRQVLGSFGVQANSWSAGSSNGLYDAGSTTAPLMGGVRFSNAVRYMSPKMSGFTGSLMLSAPETEAATATANLLPGGATATAKRRTGVDLALEYANGPAYVGFGYNLRDAGNNTNTGTIAGGSTDAGKITAMTLGGSYDLGMAKPYLNYTRQNTNAGGVLAGVATNSETTDRAWSIGVRAPVGPVTVIAGYGRVVTKNLTTVTAVINNANSEAKRNAFQIGAQYALSKRTLIEANYGQNKLDSTAVSAALARTRTDDKVSALNVGLKHSF